MFSAFLFKNLHVYWAHNISLFMFMSPSLLTDNSFQTLSWDEKTQVLHVCFHPTSVYTLLPQLKLEAGRVLRILETLKPKAILVNAQALSVTLGQEEQVELLDVASRSKVKLHTRVAILEPKDIFVQVSLHQFLTSLGLSLDEFSFFKTQKEAESWLSRA